MDKHEAAWKALTAVILARGDYSWSAKELMEQMFTIELQFGMGFAESLLESR